VQLGNSVVLVQALAPASASGAVITTDCEPGSATLDAGSPASGTLDARNPASGLRASTSIGVNELPVTVQDNTCNESGPNTSQRGCFG